jgi:hypothetical protein
MERLSAFAEDHIGLPVDEGANMFVLRRDITPKTKADNLVEA